MDDIRHLLQFLQRLIDSCADHDIITDAFMRPADPDGYTPALDGIRACGEHIRASGITRDELIAAVRELDHSSPFLREVVGDPASLAPLVLPGFTDTQEKLIRSTAQGWGLALAPADPGGISDQIRSVLSPLSLEDLLAPGVTRMQRFPVLLLLEQCGACPAPGITPPWERDDRIPIVPTDDPALFLGQISPAIFRFLARTGRIPGPCYPDLITQALAATGVFRGGGVPALGRTISDGVPHAGDLFAAGRAVYRRSGMVTDVRILYGLALQAGATERDAISGRLETLAGTVLAGAVTAASGDDPGRDAGHLLAFIGSVAGLPSGREAPGSGLIKDLEPTLQETLHLLRAVSGDYAWRAVALPRSSPGFSPLVELVPEHHVLLHNPAGLAYLTPEAVRGVVMEAWYGHRFMLDHIQGPLEDPWFILLVKVLGISRGVRKGSALHPGVSQWIDQFYREAYTVVNRCADRSRISRLPHPDQFLEGLLFEGRVGEPAIHLRDGAVRHALDVTSEARREAGSATNEECAKIIRERIWPVFRQVCHVPDGYLKSGGTDSPAGPGGRPAFTPHGSVHRPDTLVPGPHRPSGPSAGRAIVGEGDSLLEDDGFSIPGGTPGGGFRPGGSGGPRSSFPCREGGSPGPRDLASGISGTADSLMAACDRSADLLDTVASPPGNDGEEGAPLDPRETASGLRDLARGIETLAEILDQQVRQLREAYDREAGGPGQPGEEFDGLLKTSEQVMAAAREYRDAVGAATHQAETAGFDDDRVRSLTGMTMDALRDLHRAGTEFQRCAGGSFLGTDDTARPRVRIAGDDDDPGTDLGTIRSGRLEPAFVTDSLFSPAVWDSLSYFDASFDESTGTELGGPSGVRQSRDAPQRSYDPEEQALTREAEQYLSTLKQRTQSDWESLDERAERIRKIAVFESHAVGQDDYATYQRFYTPVAGLVVVARKNIQQALQKTGAGRDLTELISGDDIDEENLAAVRTTMRIFKDRARDPDRTRWCLSLLIDASSSMHDETIAKKLQATIQAAILFGEAVTGIPGIRFEIAAFSDSEYIPLKRYQDDWNVFQGCYLIRQVIHATGGTNDVGAVSSALDRMNRLRTAAGANRMIFVISDGQSGVGGREQMRVMLKTNRDTRIFGWGIGPDMEKIEETYLPYGTWVPDIADLPRSLGEVLRRELGRPAMAGWKDRRARDPGVTGEESCTT